MINPLKASGKAFLAALLICPQLSLADEFTSADVLEWTESQQNSFFQNSISMTAIVAARTGRHGEIVECMNGWYLATKAHDAIRERRSQTRQTTRARDQDRER